MIVRLGERALRIARPPGVSARALFAALKARPGVADVVVTEEHVAVHFETGVDWDFESSLALDLPEPPPKEHLVQVVYDGEDIDTIAKSVGLTVEEVIDRHACIRYEVKMIGFLPGFAYLGDLDSRLVLPRRASPRTRVPAMSLAIAGPYTAVYPFSSPGGWHLLGRALDLPTFQLELGDFVRFTP